MSEENSETLSDSVKEIQLDQKIEDTSVAEQSLRQRKPVQAAAAAEAALSEPKKEEPKPAAAALPTLEQLKALSSNPKAFPDLVLQTVQAFCDRGPPGTRLFAVTWLPLLLAGIGAVLGFLFSASGLSFVLGGFAAVMILFKPVTKDKEKADDLAAVVSTFLPLFMIDATGWLLPIFMMIAASGASFVLASMPAPQKMNEKAAVLSLTIGAVVTFGVSSGGSGVVNALLLAALYTGAGYIVPHIPLDKVREVQVLREHIFSHDGLAHVIVQTVLAKILLYFLYGLILPPFLFETQNNMFSDIIYTAIGFGVMAGGFFLQRDGTPKDYKTGYLFSVIASYIFITIILVFQEMTR